MYPCLLLLHHTPTPTPKLHSPIPQAPSQSTSQTPSPLVSLQIATKALVLIGTFFELWARMIPLLMFGVTFRELFAAVVGVEFLLKALFFAAIVDEHTAVGSLLAGIAAGSFNLLTTAPAKWVGHSNGPTAIMKVCSVALSCTFPYTTSHSRYIPVALPLLNPEPPPPPAPQKVF